MPSFIACEGKVSRLWFMLSTARDQERRGRAAYIYLQVGSSTGAEAVLGGRSLTNQARTQD